jgi:hypothetical protein
LGRIEGVGLVARQATADGVDAIVVPAQECIERGAVAALRGQHEGGVVER